MEVHTNEKIEELQAQISRLQATIDQVSRKANSLEQHQSDSDKAYSAMVKVRSSIHPSSKKKITNLLFKAFVETIVLQQDLNEFRDSQREIKEDMLSFQTQTQDALTKIMKNIMTILDSKQDPLPRSDRRVKENTNEEQSEDGKAKGDTSTVKIPPKKTESIKSSRQFSLDTTKTALPSYCDMRLADQERRESEKHHDEIAPRSLRQVPKLVKRGRGPPNS